MQRLLLLMSILIFPMTTKAIEEPEYTVARTLGNVEIREYAPFVVAEVVVDGSADQASDQGFRILAGYIFGNNKGERKFAMTAPVIQAPAPTRMEMTAPVTQSSVPEGYLVQFVLPKSVALEAAPQPIDERIKLRDVPAHSLAAITFSGLWSDANYSKHLQQLQESLRNAKLDWYGAPVFSRYNAPWTPWFMRRNEIWLMLDPDEP
jgi:SOUL heme-binding protein